MKIKTILPNLPNSIRVIKDAIKCGVSGNLIKELNYLDLQLLVINFNIENICRSLHELRQNQLREKGIGKVVEATEEDFNSL